MNTGELIGCALANGDFGALATGVPYMQTLGLRVQRVGARLVVQLAADSRHVGNPWIPALHGGVVGGLLETAAIIQLASEHRGEALPKPVNVTIDYLRSGRVAETSACAIVTRLGKRIANVRATCWQDDEARPIATLSGHFLIGRARARAAGTGAAP
ncbi:MAG: PaaI family thioesterase [Gammaproteobacteria bacterium]|uniref:PaaI family thioesterase n=1 Tax=Bradyrhizobium sp. TaxID=376 RepID=UPI003D152DC5